MRVAKLNTEEAQELAVRHGIRSIPTLALFQNGREIARQAGAMDAGSIVAWARRNAVR
jgi:thioredoxin 2